MRLPDSEKVGNLMDGKQQSPTFPQWEQQLGPAAWEHVLRNGAAALVSLRLGGQQSWNTAESRGSPSQPRWQQAEVLTMSMWKTSPSSIRWGLGPRKSGACTIEVEWCMPVHSPAQMKPWSNDRPWNCQPPLQQWTWEGGLFRISSPVCLWEWWKYTKGLCWDFRRDILKMLMWFLSISSPEKTIKSKRRKRKKWLLLRDGWLSVTWPWVVFRRSGHS